MFYVGLDLGKRLDFSAIAVVEKKEQTISRFDYVEWMRRQYMERGGLVVRHLERIRLGTPYTEVAKRAMAVGETGQSYNLAGPPATIIEALALAQRITGVPAPKRRLAPGLLRAMARTMGVVGAVVPLPQEYSAEYLRVSAGVTYLGDSTKAREHLGFSPRRLEEGLPETLQYELKQPGMRG